MKDDEWVKAYTQIEVFRWGRNCFTEGIKVSPKKKVEEGERTRIEINIQKVVHLVMMWTWISEKCGELIQGSEKPEDWMDCFN